MDLFFAAQTHELARFQHPQQFYLDGQAGFADLVQKQRSLVSQFENAAAQIAGAGEGAALVAEQLRFQQVVR